MPFAPLEDDRQAPVANRTAKSAVQFKSLIFPILLVDAGGLYSAAQPRSFRARRRTSIAGSAVRGRG
jgi:hypothetical protein